nr:unnamed protein product [Callosobruchus chinensis]
MARRSLQDHKRDANSFINNCKENIATLIDPNEIGKQVMRNAMVRHPEIKEVIDGCTEGTIEYIESQITTSRQKDDKRRRTVYFLPIRTDDKGTRYANSVRPFDESKKHASQFQWGETSHSGTERPGQKAGKRTYAELLTEVKEKVDTEKLGVNVRSLRMTAAVDLLLNVEGTDMAVPLGKEIRKQLDGSKLLLRKVTTKDDGLEALQEESGNNEINEFSVGDLRPTKNVNRVVTITTSCTAADPIIKRGYVKIGVVNCRVSEWTIIDRLRTAHSPFPVTLKGKTITIKQQTKLLGIVFDTKLYWNDHIEYLITRCKKCINLIRSPSGTR